MIDLPDNNFCETAFRNALGSFATGVTIVTTTDPNTNEPLGLTVNSFNSVSMEPPLILWCLRLTSANLEAFKRCSYYNIHVLAHDQQDLANTFARVKSPDRFEGIQWRMSSKGAPLLDSSYCTAWFECSHDQQLIVGDHLMLIGRVERCLHNDDQQPLIFHRGRFDLTPKP